MTASDDELAEAIRELALELHRTSAADDRRRGEALDLIRQAQVALSEGDRRLRWYEVDPDAPVGPRARNRELSTWAGSANAVAPPLVLRIGELDDGTPAMFGTAELNRLREGPPASVHGGVLAGMFDEIMGAAHRLNGGAAGVTGRLVVRYRHRTPLGQPLEMRAWIHQERQKLVTVRAECRSDERITAQAEALFVRRSS